MTDIDFLVSPQLEERIDIIRGRIETAIEGHSIAIVGSGPLPRKCASAIRAAGSAVSYFIEYDPCAWGGAVGGVPVISIAAARELLDEGSLVIAGVWSPNHSYADTWAWLHSFGFRNVLPAAALFWVLGPQLGEHYQLAGPECLMNEFSRIAKVHAGLADAESKRQFAAHLRWRTTLDHTTIPAPNKHRKYFDRELFLLPDDAVVVDCGAFDGDSLRSFLYWQGDRFAEYLALEPDPLSFDRLRSYVSSLPAAVAARVSPRQLAVGDVEQMIRISGTGLPGSRQASDATTCEVRCVRLDDVLSNTALHYLKLDIEGAEWDALRGAANSITANRPVIATAIYHRPTDIFALPEHIMARTTGYRYFMRSHDDDGIDFVFYAIPVELAHYTEK